MSIRISGIVLLIIACGAPTGCSAITSSPEFEEAIRELEYKRTNNCVRGGLPKEVQFFEESNPPRLDGTALSMNQIDMFIAKLDTMVASLMAESMTRAWALTTPKAAPWNAQFVSLLEVSLVTEIAERAPTIFNIEFCGNLDSVGSAAFASLAMYFGRSVRFDESDQLPQWLMNLGDSGINRRTSIVMLAISLRLARIEFDPQELVDAFAEQN